MPVIARRSALIAAAGCLALGLGLGLACTGAAAGDDCGPSEAQIARVIDGDTVELDVEDEAGEQLRVRYLMVDTPESTGGEAECYGQEAKDANAELVAGQTVKLSYDVECEDQYGRLLAYVELPSGRTINEILVERGYACVLHIPPNGEEVVDAYRALESAAQAQNKGLWANCDPPPC